MTETLTPSKVAEIAAQQAADYYREYLAAALGWLFQGGEIPGLELVPPGQVRRFFESTDPNYWTALLEKSPEEAMSQLVQWSMSDRQNEGGQQVADLYPAGVG